MINKIPITCILIVLLLESCVNTIDEIYQNRSNIIETFSGISVTNRGKFFHLEFDNDSIQDFIFENSNGRYELKNDTTNYELNFYKNGKVTKFSNKFDFDKAVKEKFDFLIGQMKKYAIKNVSTQFKDQGVVLTFYCNNTKLFYVPNIDLVKNPEWKKYLMKANKLDKYWYWVTLEKNGY